MIKGLIVAAVMGVAALSASKCEINHNAAVSPSIAVMR